MLLTFGDSFTYGEELTDLTSAWPYRMAKVLKTTVINHGSPGASNDEILRRLYEELSSTDPEKIDMVIIGWTSPGRIEFSDMVGTYSIWPGYMSGKFRAKEPWRDEMVSYLSKHHNSEWLCQRFVQNVIAAQSLLQQLGIRYLMCDIGRNEYYKNLHLGTGITEKMCNLVDSTKYAGWLTSGMAEWVGKAARGAGGHFLDEGHKLVTLKLYDFIKKNRI